MPYFITIREAEQRAELVAKTISARHKIGVNAYAVPRGGVSAAFLVKQYLPTLVLVDRPELADIFIDDIIDSGATRMRLHDTYGTNKPFYALVDKLNGPDCELNWIVFPWEHSEEKSIEDAITRILQYIGEDPRREGLLETPKRVVKSWKELFSGYEKNPLDIFKVFNEGYNELVVMQDIELYSCCEHHMLPFTGRAHVAYIADGKVIGASKLARLVEVYARRLQVQERLGVQVVEALMEHLKPKGAACIIEAKHMCMCARGIGKQHSIMKTSTMRGVFLEDSARGMAARAELMGLLSK